MDSGESCDDGNDISGDGCSATCSAESTPSLAVSIDKPAVTTELKTANMLVVTLTGGGGFSGNVNLTGSVLDAANAPIPGWTIAFSQASVAVPASGSVTAVATLTIPAQNRGLLGTVKIDVASTLGTESITSTVTVLNQVTFTVDIVNGQCVYPTDGGTGAATVPVALGTKVRFFNKGGANLEIHSNNIAAIPHQGQVNGTDDPITESQSAYERTLGGTVGGNVNWYCHAPGPNLQGGNPTIRIAAAP
ncbi:MAG: hypothetical protein M3546_17675 [Actinomycetota bacterium]|nr:hypothetical protein [Actinomycetota bacterium]